ncbi:MAG TPA: hypothetical protein VEH84_07175 [Alphaproteobacteria bacterium]|nr:hypothetical protein [Alphaproteobacteria bacterium]
MLILQGERDIALPFASAELAMDRAEDWARRLGDMAGPGRVEVLDACGRTVFAAQTGAAEFDEDDLFG